MPRRALPANFSEKDFYLQEFRGRTLAFALPGEVLGETEPLEAVLAELAANRTPVVLLSEDRAALEKLTGAPPLEADAPGLPGRVWRRLAKEPRAAVATRPEGSTRAADAALALGLTKLVYLDRVGGFVRPDGERVSFVDLAELREGVADPRTGLLAEIERLLAAHFPAVNLCTVEGLADELFTYSGSGTLFTPERYVAVRRLGIDDFDAAADLIARGVEEGYLAPRSAAQLDGILASGFGAFVDASHLAGIGALLPYADGKSGEIASLYTLTRFLGEGVGAHIVEYALEQAARQGLGRVFACTTSSRVASFFERCGFSRVALEALPAEKWQGYDAERRARLICLAHELR